MANENLKQKEYHDNRVAYFDSWVKAWIENRMEMDKQLLALSALAIGLLVSVSDKLSNTFQFFIWITAGLAFVLCAFFILIIFHKNAEYIGILLEEHQADGDNKESLGKKEQEKTQFLNKLTKIAFFLFLIGATLTIILAVIQLGFIVTKGS